MRRLLLAGVVVAMVGITGVGLAVGQGTGGTLGPGAVGTKNFTVTIRESQVGVNCGNLPQARCWRVPPRLGSVVSGSGLVSDATTVPVGRALFANIVSRRVGSQNTQDVFLATIAFNNKVDSISVMGPSSGDDSSLPYSIVGGTGTYAGARGYVTEGKTIEGRGTFSIPLTFTFIP